MITDRVRKRKDAVSVNPNANERMDSGGSDSDGNRASKIISNSAIRNFIINNKNKMVFT